MKHATTFPRIVFSGLESMDVCRVREALCAAGLSSLNMISALSPESLPHLLAADGIDLVVLGDDGAADLQSDHDLTDGLAADHPGTAFLVLNSGARQHSWSGRPNLLCLGKGSDSDQSLIAALDRLLNAVWLGRRARLFEACVEADANGIVVVDACAEDMPIVYVNPAFERITGYGLGEVYGRNCRFLQGDDRKQPGVDQLRQALRTGQGTTVQVRNYHRNGSPFWNEVQISPAREDGKRITHYIGVLTDITARMDVKSALDYSTTHDGMTGLPNFEHFKSRAAAACRESAHHRHDVALTLFNVDNFKAINATFGVESGDELLKAVVGRVKSLLGQDDEMARLSADEFAILQPEVLSAGDVDSLLKSMESVLKAPYRIQEQDFFVTVSAGTAWTREEGGNADQLLSHATLALRNAKQAGGGSCRWYSSLIAEELERTLKIHNQLQQALSQNQFELHYQPVVDPRRQEVVGVEALLRWHHPDLGLLYPADFLHAIESGGFMVEVTDWVLRTACGHLVRFMEETGRMLWVSVNISPNHFANGDLASSVKVVLDETGLPPACLSLELVESAFLSFDELTRRILEEIRTLGVGLMIDDFGAGFSSLNYLKQVPASRIKIDKSFIRDVVADSSDAAITRGVIALAHKLNLKVVGEGVEDRYQLAFLLRNHCDLVQGFLPGYPMPFSQLADFELGGAMLDALAEISSDAPDEHKVRKLLILDDEPNILRALKRVLRRDGYEIHTVSSAHEALNLLALHQFQVVLSDQRMPEMTGTDFLSRVKDLYPDTIRIVLSGYTDLESVTDAVNRGAIYKFLTKPWDDEQLRDQIRQAFVHHDAELQSPGSQKLHRSQ